MGIWSARRVTRHSARGDSERWLRLTYDSDGQQTSEPSDPPGEPAETSQLVAWRRLWELLLRDPKHRDVHPPGLAGPQRTMSLHSWYAKTTGEARSSPLRMTTVTRSPRVEDEPEGEIASR